MPAFLLTQNAVASDAPLRIRSLEPVGASWGEPCSTPFELVANSSQVRTGTEDLILALTLDLERQAAENVDAVILSSFEKTMNAPAAVASRYETLAEELDFVVAFAQKLHKRAHARPPRARLRIILVNIDALDKLLKLPV